MKKIIISSNTWASPYLRDLFCEKQLKNVTLVTDELSKELKKFLEKNIKYLDLKNRRVNFINKDNRIYSQKTKLKEL